MTLFSTCWNAIKKHIMKYKRTTGASFLILKVLKYGKLTLHYLVYELLAAGTIDDEEAKMNSYADLHRSNFLFQPYFQKDGLA